MKTNGRKIYNLTEFFGLKLHVTKDVITPHRETESLVKAVIEAKPKTVIDVGTGSGNIAISIAKSLPDCKIIATDVSDKILQVAEENAKQTGVEKQITFVKTNLIEDIEEKPVHIIAANLPYIPEARIPRLDVLKGIPQEAINGGEDGFEIYRNLFLQIIKKNLYPKYMVAEIDYTHKVLAVEEAHKYFPKCQVDIRRDTSGRQQFMVIKF